MSQQAMCQVAGELYVSTDLVLPSGMETHVPTDLLLCQVAWKLMSSQILCLAKWNGKPCLHRACAKWNMKPYLHRACAKWNGNSSPQTLVPGVLDQFFNKIPSCCCHKPSSVITSGPHLPLITNVILVEEFSELDGPERLK